MRFGFLVLVPVLSLSLIGCSSDDAPATDAGPQTNACVAAGGYCRPSFPFMCNPGDRVESSLATACGKSEGDEPRDIPCCFHVTQPPDTGTVDAVSDADASDGDVGADAGDGDVSDGDASDGDAPASDTSPDASPDATDATDASDVADAD